MPNIRELFKARPEYQVTTPPKHNGKTSPKGKSKQHASPAVDHLSAAMQSTSLGSNSQTTQTPATDPHYASFWHRTFSMPDYQAYPSVQDQNRPHQQAYIPRPGPSRTPSPIKPPPIRTPKPSSPSQTATAANASSPSASPRRLTVSAGTVQCSGVTSAGRRCTRSINVSGSPSKSTPSTPGRAYVQLQSMLAPGSSDEEVPLFCHQHSKQALSEEIVYVGPYGMNAKYAEWIPMDLPPQTKAQLRVEMSKPVSASDSPGYIYVHEMVPTSASRTALVKIGRSVKPVARLEQWRQTCPSRNPVVRDFYPLAADHPILLRHPHLKCAGATPSANGGSRLRGAFSVQEPCPYNHRWERLVLLEVAGRASMPGYAPDGRAHDKTPCGDCGKIHVELFTLMPGAYDEWVAEIILRWHMWCRNVLSS